MTILDVAFFATADAQWWTNLDNYVSGANYHGASFDIILHGYPVRPSIPPIQLPAFGPVNDRDGEPGKLRQEAHKALPQGHGIPVIFCPFKRTGEAGSTILRGDRSANGNVDWLSYIMINSNILNSQREVLAHELVHAADYSGDIDPFLNRNLHDSAPDSLMSIVPLTGPRRMVAMQERHAAALRRAYFARSA